MTMQSPGKRTRTRSERSQQFYEARSLPDASDLPLQPPAYSNPYDEVPYEGGSETAYPPNEEGVPYNGFSAQEEPYYEPNEEEAGALYEPSEEAQPFEEESGDEAPFSPAPSPADPASDLSAYYRRPSAQEAPSEAPGESAYALPTKLNLWGSYQQTEAPEKDDAPDSANVYHPRTRDWASTSRQRPVSTGYQVEEENPERPAERRIRKRHIKRWIVSLCLLAVLAGAGYLFRAQLTAWLGQLTGTPVETAESYAAVTTPAPVKAYDAATPNQISARTSQLISQLCADVALQPTVVTEACVVERSARADGGYDFYLFDASDGRLLAYFENLESGGMLPLPEGGFYVSQAPYLISENGSAMIRTADIEQTLGEKTILKPMHNGWAVIANESQTLQNYVNTDSQLLSRLWFAKAYPMLGKQTLAYVDTGLITDPEERYALYLVDAEGNATRWKTCGDMTDVVYCASGAAYMKNGDLYFLTQTSQPLMQSDEVVVYADCDAMVVKDQQTGLYGLFVHGEKHYDFVYDSIRPVESDVQWSQNTYQGDAGSITVRTVQNAAYPQPLSHYFLLQKSGLEEYVALSTQSVCPVTLP